MKEKRHSFLNYLLGVITFFGLVGVSVFETEPLLNKTFREFVNLFFWGESIMIEKMYSFLESAHGVLLTVIANFITILNFLYKILRAIVKYVKRFREYESQRSEITEQSNIDTGDDEQLEDDAPLRPTPSEQTLEEFIRQPPSSDSYARKLELVKKVDRQRCQPLKNFNRNRLNRYMRH